MKKYKYRFDNHKIDHEWINEIGQDGWELVAVLPDTVADYFLFIFKKLE